LLVFEQISRLSPDAILGLMAKFRADSFADKVDLGVGVFRDLTGNTPILDCVRRAERAVLADQTTKSYVSAGRAPGAYRPGARRVRRIARRRRVDPRRRAERHGTRQ
jgi:aspartate/tyrosine/aromatic aminotransferase